MRLNPVVLLVVLVTVFPFLFGGTFIEAGVIGVHDKVFGAFPFLFGGTFIEARRRSTPKGAATRFPFLFGGTFIEA